jgi:hypothetical protein
MEEIRTLRREGLSISGIGDLARSASGVAHSRLTGSHFAGAKS